MDTIADHGLCDGESGVLLPARVRSRGEEVEACAIKFAQANQATRVCYSALTNSETDCAGCSFICYVCSHFPSPSVRLTDRQEHTKEEEAACDDLQLAGTRGIRESFAWRCCCSAAKAGEALGARGTRACLKGHAGHAGAYGGPTLCTAQLV